MRTTHTATSLLCTFALLPLLTGPSGLHIETDRTVFSSTLEVTSWPRGMMFSKL